MTADKPRKGREALRSKPAREHVLHCGGIVGNNLDIVQYQDCKRRVERDGGGVGVV
jgi:hypothetical protein